MARRRRSRYFNKPIRISTGTPIEVKVRCCGSLHKIVLHTNGQLAFPGHESVKQLEKEDLMVGFGAKECRCAIILRAWRNNDPKPMPKELGDVLKGKRPNDRLWFKFAGVSFDYNNVPEFITVATKDGAHLAKVIYDEVVKTLKDRGHKVKISSQRINEIDGKPCNFYCYGYTHYASVYGSGTRASFTIPPDTVNTGTPTQIEVKLREMIMALERDNFDHKVQTLNVFDAQSPRMKKKLEMLQSLFEGDDEVRVFMDHRGMSIRFDTTTRDTSQITALALQLKKMTEYVQNKKTKN